MEGLWIGSLVCANDRGMLHAANISTVVSLGCIPDLPEGVQNIAFPDILDTAESIILHILPQTDRLIANKIGNSENCLIHCVYGQSRSATVCVSYLISTGMTLEIALKTLRDSHPNICINPGFLGQLYALVNDAYVAEYRIIMSTGSRLATRDRNKIPSVGDMTLINSFITCRKCSRSLSKSECILCNDSERSHNLKSFVDSNVDGFWRGYMPLHPHSDHRWSETTDSFHIVSPENWMEIQMDSCRRRGGTTSDGNPGESSLSSMDVSTTTAGDLTCPGCDALCGFWKVTCISLCAGYLLCDVFALLESAVKLPRGVSVRVNSDAQFNHDTSKNSHSKKKRKAK